MNNNNKNNTNRVRPVAEGGSSPATIQAVYDIPLSTIIDAWLDCERQKRGSNSCIKFRWHAARDLAAMWQQVTQGTYTPGTSICFMVTKPVLREVWAGAFRDRVMHHWEALRFGPVIEDYFRDVGDRSMNCRKGYGSLRAVRTFEQMLSDYTDGYTRDDCYIVGGDFANFFMSIDKTLLWDKLSALIGDRYEGEDKAALLAMMRSTLFHRCQERFIRYSPEHMWRNLPPRKSLFHMDGLPIGNLPSQIWANFIGAIFTDWMVHVKKAEGFIIFVDDWRCLVKSKEEGRRLIAEVKEFLETELHVALHPDKIYLQHYTKGTKFVGAVIKPRRVYVSNRTRGAFITAVKSLNKQATDRRDKVAMLEKVRATVNSYLGLMCHYSSYKIRRRIAEELILPLWGEYLYFTDEFKKCVIREKYNQAHLLRKRLKKHDFARRFLRPKWD